jgi:hypothetical protein
VIFGPFIADAFCIIFFMVIAPALRQRQSSYLKHNGLRLCCT